MYESGVFRLSQSKFASKCFDKDTCTDEPDKSSRPSPSNSGLMFSYIEVQNRLYRFEIFVHLDTSLPLNPLSSPLTCKWRNLIEKIKEINYCNIIIIMGIKFEYFLRDLLANLSIIIYILTMLWFFGTIIYCTQLRFKIP